jgi:hypothetical protein
MRKETARDDEDTDPGCSVVWPHARSARCTHLTFADVGLGFSVAGGFLDNLEKRMCPARLPSHSSAQRGPRGVGFRKRCAKACGGEPLHGMEGRGNWVVLLPLGWVYVIVRQGCLPRAASITRDGEGTGTSLPLGASAGAPSPRVPHPTVAASAKGFRTGPTRCQGSQPTAGCTVALAAGPISRSQVVTGTAHTPRAQSGRGVAGDAVTADDSARRRASAAQAERY